jgi:diamine N-acetyltransferase
LNDLNCLFIIGVSVIKWGGIMSVILKNITKENWIQAIELRVKKEQEEFVASNLFSIAQSKVEPNCIPVAVYDNDIMIGFIMYGYDDDEGFKGVWIARLMVDAKYQGKGYGRAAMEELLKQIKKENSMENIYISFEPENTVARKLYESLGFKDTGKIVGGEIVFCLEA